MKRSEHIRMSQASMLSWFVAILPMFLLTTSASQLPEQNLGTGTPLPAYTFPYTDGLYGTIAGYLSMPKVKIPMQQKFKLMVPGFAEEFPVYAVFQEHPAPLAVVLLGVSGRADADFSKLWPAWFAEAGYHVLSFDSTFRPSFVDISGDGASGNIWKESELVGNIISAFLQCDELNGKVTDVGVAGMSYGAVQALLLGQMAREGRLPFKIGAIQAYSPPIKIEKTAEILDDWYRTDRWKYTLVQLQNEVGKHKPATCCPAPLSQSLMRAAVAVSFRIELTKVVVHNDEKFAMERLPRGDAFNDEAVRRDYAATWGFLKYGDEIAFPYWSAQLGNGVIKQLLEKTHLCALLQAQPPCSETILAEDDPFDQPEDMSELKACAPASAITFLPHGGHLGYVGEPWTKAKLLSLFACSHSLARNP